MEHDLPFNKLLKKTARAVMNKKTKMLPAALTKLKKK